MSHGLTLARTWQNDKVQLQFAPHHLSFLDMVALFALIFVKYIYHILGRLPKWETRGEQYRMPKVELNAPLTLTTADVQKYQKAVGHDSCGFILVALTTPLMLLLVTNAKCPLLPIGCVNTKNRFEFIDCANLVGQPLHVNATFGRTARKVKRGIEVDLNVCVFRGETMVFRQVITILQFMKHKNPPKAMEEDALEAKSASLSGTSPSDELVIIDKAAPSRWSAICLDYNPIHMSLVGARLFGFSSRIAHGNYVVAAYLAKRIIPMPGAVVEVAFKRPMLIPTELQALEGGGGGASRDQKGGWLFQLVKHGKVHVLGSVTVQ